jgi:hypothetical protein
VCVYMRTCVCTHVCMSVSACVCVSVCLFCVRKGLHAVSVSIHEYMCVILQTPPLPRLSSWSGSDRSARSDLPEEVAAEAPP